MSELLHEQTASMKKEASKGKSAELSYSYGSAVPKLFAGFMGVAAIGWLVSVFLTGVHFWALPLPAGFEVAGTPWAVMSSQFAYVLGIPLALFGAIYYLTVLVMSGMWFQTRHPLVLKVLTPMTAIGVMASAVFVYLQLFVINAICPFCMVSAAATTILLTLEIIMIKKSNLPSLSQLIKNAPAALDRKALTWMGFMFGTAALGVLGFWFVTLLPVANL